MRGSDMDWPLRFPEETKTRVEHLLESEQGAISRARLDLSADRIDIEDALCQCALGPHIIFMEAMCEQARNGVYQYDEVKKWDRLMLKQFLQDTLNEQGRDWQGSPLEVTVNDIEVRLPEAFRDRRQERLNELWEWQHPARTTAKAAAPLRVYNPTDGLIPFVEYVPCDAATDRPGKLKRSWILKPRETGQVPDWVRTHFKEELEACIKIGALIVLHEAPPPEQQNVAPRPQDHNQAAAFLGQPQQPPAKGDADPPQSNASTEAHPTTQAGKSPTKTVSRRRPNTKRDGKYTKAWNLHEQGSEWEEIYKQLNPGTWANPKELRKKATMFAGTIRSWNRRRMRRNETQ